jgi:hypothetical protein
MFRRSGIRFADKDMRQTKSTVFSVHMGSPGDPIWTENAVGVNFDWLSTQPLRNFPTPGKDRMNIHNNARQTPIGRERIVRQVLSE